MAEVAKASSSHVSLLLRDYGRWWALEHHRPRGPLRLFLQPLFCSAWLCSLTTSTCDALDGLLSGPGAASPECAGRRGSVGRLCKGLKVCLGATHTPDSRQTLWAEAVVPEHTLAGFFLPPARPPHPWPGLRAFSPVRYHSAHTFISGSAFRRRVLLLLLTLQLISSLFSSVHSAHAVLRRHCIFYRRRALISPEASAETALIGRDLRHLWD